MQSKLSLNIQKFDTDQNISINNSIKKEVTSVDEIITSIKVIVTPNETDTVDFENDFVCVTDGWTKLGDGKGSVYKVFTENVTTSEELIFESSTTTDYYYNTTFEINITEIGTMYYERINWEAGKKVSDAYVDLITGEFHPAVYEGNTPITPQLLNKMDKAISYLFEKMIQ